MLRCGRSRHYLIDDEQNFGCFAGSLHLFGTQAGILPPPHMRGSPITEECRSDMQGDASFLHFSQRAKNVGSMRDQDHVASDPQLRNQTAIC